MVFVTYISYTYINCWVRDAKKAETCVECNVCVAVIIDAGIQGDRCDAKQGTILIHATWKQSEDQLKCHGHDFVITGCTIGCQHDNLDLRCHRCWKNRHPGDLPIFMDISTGMRSCVQCWHTGLMQYTISFRNSSDTQIARNLVKSLRKFSQSKAVILPSSVQNFQTIWP